MKLFKIIGKSEELFLKLTILYYYINFEEFF